jgi:Cofactor assembly of complex C subunit B, CCB2/CCB4
MFCCRWPGYTVEPSQLRSEALCVACGLLLLVQALIDRSTDAAVDRRRAALASDTPSTDAVGSADAAAADAERSTYVAASVANSAAERMRWAGGMLLQLTPACSIVMLSSADSSVIARYVLC